MTQFRKKPVVIEAVPVAEVLAANDGPMAPELPDWVTEALEAQVKPVAGKMERVLVPVPEHEGVNIQTSEGVMFGGFDDWLIRGVKGELYPCKPDIFEASYERGDSGALRATILEALVDFSPTHPASDVATKAYDEELASTIASAIEQPSEP